MTASKGPVERAVRADVRRLGGLTGVQGSLAQSAYALARELDEGAGLSTAAIARELRATLDALTKGSDDDENARAIVAQLSSPVWNAANGSRDAGAAGSAGR